MRGYYAHIFLALWISLVALELQLVSGRIKRKVHLSYPVDLLGLADYFEGNITRDRLTCFGNRDQGVPTYRETFLCMTRLPFGHSCHCIWGSRSVVVDVKGSAEFFKLSKLPPGSLFNEHVSVNATRWMELTAVSSYLHQREVRQVPSEPIYLCARSNDWTGATAQFHISFRPGYLRERDKELCHSKFLIHVLLVVAVSSVWLIPYLAALVVATLTFSHGIKFFIAVLLFSCCIVAMTPLMLTKKNRHLARLYIGYFFTRVQAEETKMVVRQRLPVFQALFFSSVLVCVGSAGSYIIYTYCGIDRETRNTLLRATMGVAASWFIFFLCRSFERFCVDWMWILISIGLAQLLDAHMNPLSRDEAIVSTLVVSLLIRMALHRGIKAVKLRSPSVQSFAFSVPHRLNSLPLRVPQPIGRLFSSFRTLLRKRLRVYGDQPTADQTAAAAAVAAVSVMEAEVSRSSHFIEEAAAAVLGAEDDSREVGGFGDDDRMEIEHGDDEEDDVGILESEAYLDGDAGERDSAAALSKHLLRLSLKTSASSASLGASRAAPYSTSAASNKQLWETLQEGGIDTPDIRDALVSARQGRGDSITSLSDALEGRVHRLGGGANLASLSRMGSFEAAEMHTARSSEKIDTGSVRSNNSAEVTATTTTMASMVEAAAEVASMGGEILEMFLGSSYDADEDFNDVLSTTSLTASGRSDSDRIESQDRMLRHSGSRDRGFGLAGSRLSESQRSVSVAASTSSKSTHLALGGGGVYHMHDRDTQDAVDTDSGVVSQRVPPPLGSDHFWGQWFADSSSVSPRKQSAMAMERMTVDEAEALMMLSAEARNRLALAEAVGVDLDALALLPLPLSIIAGTNPASVVDEQPAATRSASADGVPSSAQEVKKGQAAERQVEFTEQEMDTATSPKVDTRKSVGVDRSRVDGHTPAGDNDVNLPPASSPLLTPRLHRPRPHVSHQQPSLSAMSALLWPSEQYTNVVGSMALPISALGPLIVDGFSVWVPVMTHDTHLLECVRASLCAFGDAGGVATHLFDPVSESTSLHASLSLPTYAAAIAMQSWASQTNNKEILRSIAFGNQLKYQYSGHMSPRQLAASGFLKFRAVGRTVHITLKMLAPSGNAVRTHALQYAQPSSLTPMDRLILALLEQFPEATITNLGSEFHGSRVETAGSVSAPSIGVEAMLTSEALAALGIDSLEDFVEAASMLKKKDSTNYKRRLVQAAAAVVATLGLDSSLAVDAVASTVEVEIVKTSTGKLPLPANSARLARKRPSSRSLLKEEAVEDAGNGIVPDFDNDDDSGDDDDDDEDFNDDEQEYDNESDDEGADDVDLGQIDQSASDDSGDDDVDDSSHPEKPRQRKSTEKTKAVKRVVSLLVTVPSILPEVNVLNVISSGCSRGHTPVPSTSRSSNGSRGCGTGASSEPPHLGTPRPGEHTTTSGVTALKGVTVTCLRLLLGEMGESGLVEHAPSRILSAVIAAVYVSLVVETAHSGFFRALQGMRGPLRSSDRHEEGHEKEVRGSLGISESTCTRADATDKTAADSSGNYGSGKANVARKRERRSSKAAINRRKGFRDLRDRDSKVR